MRPRLAGPPAAQRGRGGGGYTDGARADQEDPFLARAAWAVHVPGSGGASRASPVGGAQTARKGELSAVAAAAET
eukprot:957007-Lingulodinium_polyedra.AAC.1